MIKIMIGIIKVATVGPITVLIIIRIGINRIKEREYNGHDKKNHPSIRERVAGEKGNAGLNIQH